MCLGFARHTMPLVVGAVGLVLLAGCAGQKAVTEDWWGSPEEGVVLRYRMPEGEALVYEVTNESDQHMGVMGETTDVSSSETLTFSLVPGAMKSHKQKLDITIEGLEFNIVSDQGTVSPPTDAVVGRGFTMSVSDLGVENGCEAAEELKYNVIKDARGLSTEFCSFFTDLPEGPVAIGDTWESTTNAEPTGGGSGVTLELTSNNTLVGFETVNGHECARVETEFTGTMGGTSTQGPATITIKGNMEGSGTWHFAYMEGFLVDEFSTGTSDGEVLVQGPQEMTIPTTREFTMETKLVESVEEAARTSSPQKKPIEKTATPVMEPPLIVKAGPFTVMGVPRRFESVEDTETADFDELWTNEFMPFHDVLLPLSTNQNYYGVSYGTGEGDSFYYLAGMAVMDEVETPQGLTRYDVPEATYAVFKTKTESIGNAWDSVFEDWLPNSNYEYDWQTPSYEEYPPDANLASTVLLYVPILEKKPR